jgi:hypothetical protein
VEDRLLSLKQTALTFSIRGIGSTDACRTFPHGPKRIASHSLGSPHTLRELGEAPAAP